MLGCHHGFGCRLSGSRSKLHSSVRLSGPFLGADLPPAERRAQVLSRMPLAAPARSAGSSWTRPSTALCLFRFGLYESNQREVGPPASSKTATPNHVLPVIPGDRNEPSSVTVRQRGVGLQCRPIGQQRSCCDDQLNPPCEPWSEWWITPLGRRVMSAMFRASSTSRVASVVAIDQPTMRRLKASSTTAR